MQVETSDQHASPKPLRSWKRFSVRALLVCIALVAFPLAHWCSQRRLEQEIVHIVREHEGAVYIDFREDIWGRIRRWCTPFHDSFAKGEMLLEISVANMTSSEREELFDRLARRGRVNGIDVYGADDEVLKAIGEKLTGITYLRIIGPAVTDDGLACLQRLENLGELQLVNTSVSGSGFSHFCDTSRLYRLKIDFSKLTDAGAAELIRFRNLQILDLELNDQVTKASVYHLGRIPSLTRVNLSGAGITEDQVAKLWTLLPNLMNLNRVSRPSEPSNASSGQLPARTESAGVLT